MKKLWMGIVTACVFASMIICGAAANAQISILTLKTVQGTVSGANVISGPSVQNYTINVTAVIGVPAASWYTSAGLVPYYGNIMNGNFKYSDSLGREADCSCLRITSYSSNGFSGYTRVVYSSPISQGLFAFYNIGYLSEQNVLVNGVQKQKVGITLKNWRGVVIFSSSGYLN